MKTIASKHFDAAPIPRSLLLDHPPATKSASSCKSQPGEASPGPDANELPLNMNELQRRCMGRLEFAQRLLTSFETRFPIESAEIVGALAKKDKERSARLVHQLKGTTANICAPALNRTLQQMERLVGSEQFGDAERLLTELDREWQRFFAFRHSQETTP